MTKHNKRLRAGDTIKFNDSLKSDILAIIKTINSSGSIRVKEIKTKKEIALSSSRIRSIE